MKRILFAVLALVFVCSTPAPIIRGPVAVVGTASYVASATDFGADYLNRGADLSADADAKTGTVSLWFKRTTTATEEHIISTSPVGQGFTVFITAGDLIEIDAYNTSNSQILKITSGAATVADTGVWHHIMVSWDLANTSNRAMYLDGVSVINPVVYTNDTIDYTQTDWTICSRGDAFGKFTGCVSEIWFDNTYFDLTSSGNRAKFYSAGAPVNLGATGSTPTGSQPLIYLANASGTFQTNLGKGGNFSVNGSLAACGTHP